MKIAMPVSGDRVSTVFDAADELLIVEMPPDGMPTQSRALWRADTLIARIAQIRESGAQVLICGALSGAVERMFNAAGIRVIPFIRGTDSEILDAYRNGTLMGRQFLLPGCMPPCRGQARQRRHARKMQTGRIKKL